ncbi:MAG: amidohydrolase family protein, partial [Gemmatimonadota bacterium]|nr:amidohydrolase family protein [Gemmatimonadota bacterium]
MDIKIIIVSSFMLLAALSAGCSKHDRESQVRQRIATGVQAVRLIDTHEHIGPESRRVKSEQSLFTCLHYALSDVWADGLDKKLTDRIFKDPSVPLEEKWALIAPYWDNVRHTAYTRNLRKAFHDLYGVDDINESTYMELSRKIQESNRPGWYREVLHNKAGIDLSICDVGLRGRELDPSLFRAVLRFDDFLLFWNSFGSIEENWGVEINDLADWEEALDSGFRKVREWGFVGIKAGIAYIRSLEFDLVERAEAEAVFNRLVKNRTLADSLTWREKKPLQDYMFARIAELCAHYDLPLQIHTGFFYDTWRDVSQADPTNLTPFIIRHKDTRFVLMHCGYPYGGELLAMAKNLPNVILDMCWIYVISPSFAADFLNQAIETVPADKVLAFGGDYLMPEGSYGHALLCRKVVSKVLAEKVLDGYWTEEEALEYAR